MPNIIFIEMAKRNILKHANYKMIHGTVRIIFSTLFNICVQRCIFIFNNIIFLVK